MVTLINQYYTDPEADRREEIDDCLRRNLGNPAIDRVYCLIEPGTSLPADLASHPKLVSVDVPGRMTYLMAFEFANHTLPEGAVVVIANSDIFLPEDCAAWSRIAEPGQRGVFDPLIEQPKPIALCLSRHELNSRHEPYRHPKSFIGNCQDAWVLQTPIRHTPKMDFPVGNAPTCENRIAWTLAEAGYDTWNWSDKYRIHHLDLARKGGIVKIIYNDHTDRELATRTDLGLRRVCPYFSYEEFLGKVVGNKNKCDVAGEHQHSFLANTGRSMASMAAHTRAGVLHVIRFVYRGLLGRL